MTALIHISYHSYNSILPVTHSVTCGRVLNHVLRFRNGQGVFLFFLFFYFRLRWVFIAACGLFLVAASRDYYSLCCGGFSCCRAWALGAWASVVVAHGLNSCGSWALEHRLSSCGARALLLCGMWDLPGPGLEPVSPALAGGFLTTVPSGKPQICFYLI